MTKKKESKAKVEVTIFAKCEVCGRDIMSNQEHRRLGLDEHHTELRHYHRSCGPGSKNWASYKSNGKKTPEKPVDEPAEKRARVKSKSKVEKPKRVTLGDRVIEFISKQGHSMTMSEVVEGLELNNTCYVLFNKLIKGNKLRVRREGRTYLFSVAD